MTKTQRTSALPPDDEGADKLLSADATATRRFEMLELVEQSLARPNLPQAERLRLLDMARYWERGLDRRLAALAAGTKPSSKLLPDPADNPAILSAIAAAAQTWSPANAVAV